MDVSPYHVVDVLFADVPQVLVRALASTGTKYDVVVMVPPDLPVSVQLLLAFEGAVVRVVHGLRHPRGEQHALPMATHLRNRVHVWALTEYRRVVLLDETHSGTACSCVGLCRRLDHLLSSHLVTFGGVGGAS